MRPCRIFPFDEVPTSIVSLKNASAKRACTVTSGCRLLSAISIFRLNPQNAPMSSHIIEPCRYCRSRMALLSASLYQNISKVSNHGPLDKYRCTYQPRKCHSNNLLQHKSRPADRRDTKAYTTCSNKSSHKFNHCRFAAETERVYPGVSFDSLSNADFDEFVQTVGGWK